MSNATYHELWIEAQTELADVLQEDNPEAVSADLDDTTAAFQIVANTYIKYIQILRKFNDCYDQMVHPQKRRVVRILLDAVIGRILELKQDLTNLESKENHYFDDIVLDMKLTPADMEIPIPKYILLDRELELEERDRNLDELIASIPPPEEPNEMDAIVKTIRSGKTPVPPVVRMPDLDEAIRLIQVHERGRQGRVKTKSIKMIMLQQHGRGKSKPKKSHLTHEAAVKLIQKFWRGYKMRSYTRKCRDEELIFLGMAHIPKTGIDDEKDPLQIRKTEETEKRAIQKLREADYQAAVLKAHEYITDNESTAIEEEIKEKIRQWALDIMYALGKIPPYPTEEEGGSKLILDDILTVEEFDRREKAAAAAGKEKPKEKEKAGKGELDAFTMTPSNFLAEMMQQVEAFDNVWKFREEGDNMQQRHDQELVFDMKRLEIKDIIRLSLDEVMLLELERMEEALAKDKGEKWKKRVVKKPKTKKGKKKEKDLTPDRTLESLYEELVYNGIVQKYPKTYMKDFLGEYSYVPCYLHQNKVIPAPPLTDIRRLVTQYCILPLGSEQVHMRSPFIKSVLLVGPAGCGKTMLVNTICTETGANLFDLSPINIAGKYPGKDGLKMLLHLVKKVGALLQPSVILIEDADWVFAKKVTKEMKPLDQKRMKGPLPKYLKSFAIEERILLIGTSREPYNSDPKGLGKLFQKIIMVPAPDYATRHTMWKTFIEREMKGKAFGSIDFSVLAKISDMYTGGMIEKVVKTVLTEYRKSFRHGRPITMEEFVLPLAKFGPIFVEEENAYKAFYWKTPLGKKLLTILEESA